MVVVGVVIGTAAAAAGAGTTTRTIEDGHVVRKFAIRTKFGLVTL